MNIKRVLKLRIVPVFNPWGENVHSCCDNHPRSEVLANNMATVALHGRSRNYISSGPDSFVTEGP